MFSNGEQFTAEVGKIDTSLFQTEAERSKARLAVSELMARLESPWEKAMRLIWSAVSVV